MRRQLIVNATLVALALGTLGVVWATRDVPTTAGLEARKNKLFASWDKDAITRVHLRRGAAELELARAAGAAGDFRIVKPWSERADIATVNALLGSLELASSLRPADGVARDAAGLAKPTLEIRLEMAGKSQRITLGGPAPAPAGARYAEVESAGQSARLFTVSPGLVSELDLPWDKFREPRLLEYGRSDFAKIQLEGPSGRSELVPNSHGAFLWQASTGAELANPETTERILTTLARLATEQFVEPEVARAALGPEPVRVRLELKEAGASVITVALGGTCPSAPERAVALRERAGQAARAGCVPRELADALRVTPDALAWARPFAARPDEVEELRIARNGAKLELARKGSGFLLRLPTQREVALQAGNQRLAELLGAEGRSVRQPNLAELGLAPAAGEVTVQIAAAGQDSRRSERIAVGATRPDGGLCLRRDADGVVLCVPADAVSAFAPDAAPLLASLELLAFAPSELVSFELQTPHLKQRVERRPDGSFELQLPQGFPHDGALVTDIVRTLGTLRAERWLSGQDDANHGLATPRVRVSVEFRSGGEPSRRELRVGSETRGGFFASSSLDPSVYVLARSTVLALEAPLVDRALCPFSPEELSRIELRAGAKQLVLERRGDSWQAAGLTPTRAAELGETLSALRADVTVHLGAPKPVEGLAKPSLIVTFVAAHGKQERLRVGSNVTLAGTRMAYARRESLDATFALAGATLVALQDF